MHIIFLTVTACVVFFSFFLNSGRPRLTTLLYIIFFWLWVRVSRWEVGKETIHCIHKKKKKNRSYDKDKNNYNITFLSWIGNYIFDIYELFSS